MMARTFRVGLRRWACHNGSDFPWRRVISSFHALTTEILLQRTRAEKVVAVFPEFCREFPSPEYLARADISIIRGIIHPLGLLWRAEFLRELAREIVSRKGCIPDQFDQLITLPGVGQYTANAYLSLHLGFRRPIIDSNTVRFYSRLTGRPYNGETRRKAWVAELAEVITPHCDVKRFNYALLDFTRLVCRPKSLCDSCFFASRCQSSNAKHKKGVK